MTTHPEEEAADMAEHLEPAEHSEPVDCLERRVSGSAESYLLAQRHLGFEVPMQIGWVFTSDPGMDAVRAFHDRVTRSGVALAAVSPRVPVARHRWQRPTTASPLHDDPAPVSDDATMDWFNTHQRCGPLAPTAGRAWHLATTRTDSGRRLLSLITSHVVGDGIRTTDEVARAMAGAPPRHVVADGGSWRDDLADAAGQLGAAAGAARSLLAAAFSAKNPRPNPTPNARTRPVTPRPAPVDTPDPIEVILTVDRARWEDCAAAHAGTSNSLLCAVMAGLAQRAGVPTRSGHTSLGISVDGRVPNDRRVNVAVGVTIRIPGPIDPQSGLGEIRALTKHALAQRDSADDPTHTLARLVPPVVLKRIVPMIPGPQASASNLGPVPPPLMTLGDVTAADVVFRAGSRGQSPAFRRRTGLGVSGWVAIHPGHITLAVAGMHPDCFTSTDQMRGLVSAELDRWGLAHTYW
ncbi:hypothetical protein [Williamsia sp. CHRR-6]|uniref:hypothetical protein n=1 Tax=Williamsia sp. CHRR-6 TaxID=2835871 RepID=UPI001BDA2300|nr:hypothetical protein [Williamsia sp. CHRR-6]MBT0566874.1 hypothetical protein [Williamsia sp. CHRR-6]